MSLPGGDRDAWLAELDAEGTVSNVAGLIHDLTEWGEARCLRAAQRLLAVLDGDDGDE